MSCPIGVNTGFVQLVGQITVARRNNITTNENPIIINFDTTRVTPTLTSNKIDITGSSSNTCMYKGKTFTLIDMQICKVMHSGYLVSQTVAPPVAELIMSFYSNSTSLPRILMCMPIYNYDTPIFNTYLDNVLNPSADIATDISLESFFYDASTTIKQSSYAYTTCIETQLGLKKSSFNLYVLVFPNGIHLTSQNYEKLKTKIGTLPSYMMPTAMRNGEETVKSFTVNANGDKTNYITSADGVLNSISINTSTDDFINLFEYFNLPPHLQNSSKNKDQCPYYKTSQYKCVPFNQIKDLSGTDIHNAYVRTGTKSLDTILDEKNQLVQKQKDENERISKLDETEEYIAIGISSAFALCVVAGLIYVVVK